MNNRMIKLQQNLKTLNNNKMYNTKSNKAGKTPIFYHLILSKLQKKKAAITSVLMWQFATWGPIKGRNRAEKEQIQWQGKEKGTSEVSR